MILAVLFAALLLLAPACQAGRAVVDNHSFSRPSEVLVEHIDLDLEVDFERERIGGTATLHFRNLVDASTLSLDTYRLDIARVTAGDRLVDVDFSLGEERGLLGQPLIIDIGPDFRSVTVHYETTEDATAPDWLAPEQTAGGEKPFLFTQGQSILNRSWIPCQDTPAVRVTYSARIKTDPGLMAVMSARNGQSKSENGIYEFEMPQPIAPYLIALAVGDLEFRPISERCGVYAEPSVVERAAWEFADTEEMMQRAEALYGAYRWERYDVIVLPPSFPFGGMENPRLSFVTPVLVAGDRSLVSTIAHELAHSWSGNLVTNATWDDFWLNEGFTTYFERRILEAVYGTEQMEMEALLGLRDLQDVFDRRGSDAASTRLRRTGESDDPEDGLGTVAYEKGYLFLRLLEETVGRERWDRFLRTYFDRFAFETMTTDRFVAYLRAELVDEQLDGQIGIDEWVYAPGLPANHPRIESAAFDEVLSQVDAWSRGAAAMALETDGWSTHHWKQFLQNLPDTMTTARMAELDDAFSFTKRSNAELLKAWFLRAVPNEYERAYPAMERYLMEIGRIWMIAPVYRSLAATPGGRERARRIYEGARPGYHKLAIRAIDRILLDDQ